LSYHPKNPKNDTISHKKTYDVYSKTKYDESETQLQACYLAELVEKHSIRLILSSIMSS